ncbi:MAG TPA: 3-deoxy-manno-octulosonate cytidylyltransferase, partial [archaeon]|nr:3-deoxy-manno-octulosonate cytidylyltransferase [archaeon]
AVERFGGKAAMTHPAARSGTDRVAEVARERAASVIINVQGDEPLVRPDMVDQLAEYLARHAAVPMVSLMTKLERPEDRDNPNVVKVVTDRDGFALYFSRAAIPFARAAEGSGLWALGKGPQPPAPSPQLRSCKHLGIYGYQRHFLLKFPSLEPTPLEESEQLEQLRALEHGYRIKLLETTHDTVGVDTAEDLVRVEQLLVSSEKRAAT